MKRRKFVVAGTVIGSLMLTQGAFAAELAVTPSQNKLSVQSGNLVQNVDAVPAYLYQGNNYFKLRDVGKIVGYNVIWDNATKRISMTKDLTAQDLKNLSGMKQAKAVQKKQQTIFIGENEYKNMDCLNIDGFNYFKLRDLAKAMDFSCGWDASENMIQLKIENSVETPSTGITVDQFINPDLNQQIIEENVSYITGSHNYSDLETYMQKNVDKEFKARDFIIVENDMNGLLAGSGVIYLDMRLNVNGVISNNFGYLVTCINGKAALITFIGEKNPEFDITKAGTQQLSDEEAKQKTIEADGYKYKVDEQRITRFFDMKELKQKCEVETVYIDDGGHYFATSNIF